MTVQWLALLTRNTKIRTLQLLATMGGVGDMLPCGERAPLQGCKSTSASGRLGGLSSQTLRESDCVTEKG